MYVFSAVLAVYSARCLTGIHQNHLNQSDTFNVHYSSHLHQLEVFPGISLLYCGGQISQQMHQDAEMEFCLHSSYVSLHCNVLQIFGFMQQQLHINHRCKVKEFYSRCITWITITQQLDFGAMIYTQGQTQLQHTFTQSLITIAFGMAHTSSNLNLDYLSIQHHNYEFYLRKCNLNTQRPLAPLIYQLLDFKVRITIHHMPSLIYSTIRTILTLYLESYTGKLFWLIVYFQIITVTSKGWPNEAHRT